MGDWIGCQAPKEKGMRQASCCLSQTVTTSGRMDFETKGHNTLDGSMDLEMTGRC